eukprot:106174-Hanusia_phi.AAC.2
MSPPLSVRRPGPDFRPAAALGGAGRGPASLRRAVPPGHDGRRPVCVGAERLLPLLSESDGPIRALSSTVLF